jgi:hypothetical protein
MFTKKEATAIAGTLGFPSKMPGTSYGIPAKACQLGAILNKIKGSTCHGCYALKGNYLYDSVAMSQNNRLHSLADPFWVPAMVTLIKAAHKDGANAKVKSPGWHRWHDSGDLQGVWHLEKICQIAELTPEIRHWLPTREAKMLADFVEAGGIVPDNLIIRVSATMIDGKATARWFHTSTVHTKEIAGMKVCPAPTQNNECGSCRACWDKEVQNVSYHKH